MCRAISGEKTAFAYSDDISLDALGAAADATRAIARAGQQIVAVQKIDSLRKTADGRIEVVGVAWAGDDAVETVVTAEERVGVEMVLLGTGVRPRTDLAEAAGIERGETGAIATDPYRETNVPDVYAAGDCAEATSGTNSMAAMGG